MTGETRTREAGKISNRRGVSARLSRLVFGANWPPSAYGYNAQELDSAARERMFVEARPGKEQQARDKLIEVLNGTDLDFSKSFTGAFRPKGAYVKFPAAKRVIWTTYTDLIFSQQKGVLEIRGEKHGTEIRGDQFRTKSQIDPREHGSYSFGVELAEDGSVADLRLPRDYAYRAIKKKWHGREDLACMEDVQEDFRAAAYEDAAAYALSFSVFMAREADQTTVAYSDGLPPARPPIERHRYAEDWGMHGSSHWVDL